MNNSFYPWAHEMTWIKPKPYDKATYEPPYRPLSYHEPEHYKPYTIEQLRKVREMRREAGIRGFILPALPCITKPCMACEGYRVYWDEQLKDPATLSLF